ncbi:MAG: hypothetical protein CMD96_05935 [Gammaproteobacteria bacterium]|nr:hypothetical protein [Gammaproteobacteria bacterium]
MKNLSKKKSRKKPITPVSQIKNVLRQLWLRSRERAKALKDSEYCCTICGIKQSTAKGKEVKLEVHHKDGIDWTDLAETIRKRLLSGVLQPLCIQCHKEKHNENETV